MSDIIEKNNLENLLIIESYAGHLCTSCKFSGKIFNEYHLVFEINNITNKFYIMYCSDNSYFFFSLKSLNIVKNYTWYKMTNGYIATMVTENNKKKQNIYIS